MKILALIFLIVLTFTNCQTVQTQQNSDNISQPTPPLSNIQNNGNEAGYARFTTSDKQYLGCWRTVKEPEVVNYELRFFQFTNKTLQISKIRKSLPYFEKDSNPHKDYFVLQLDAKVENNQIKPYLSINMVSNDEMTIADYPNEDFKPEESEHYWALKREDCKTVLKQLNK